MTYTYRANVTMAVDLDIEAESFDVAEELVHQYLYPASEDGRVSINCNDGIVVDGIESDDDPVSIYEGHSE